MEKTLIKGLVVLEALALKGEPCGVSDLAAALKLSKSNVHRLLSTLVSAGFATVHDGRYAASLKLWELGAGVIKRYDARRVARSAMESLAKATEEEVRLTVLDPGGLEVVYIDKIDSPQAVRTFTEVGGRAPAHCTSSGKVLLAYQDAAVIKAASRKLKSHTPATITNSDEFIRHLEKVRRDGYALNSKEFSAQVRGVSAPIFGADGKIVAALSIAAPAERLTQSVLRHHIAAICAAAAKVSAEMRSSPTKNVEPSKTLGGLGHKIPKRMPKRSRRARVGIVPIAARRNAGIARRL